MLTFVPTILSIAVFYLSKLVIKDEFTIMMVTGLFSFLAFIINLLIVTEGNKNGAFDTAGEFDPMKKDEWVKVNFKNDFEELIK